MTTSMSLFIKLAVTIMNLLVAVDPALKDNAIVKDILLAIDALHLSATQAAPH